MNLMLPLRYANYITHNNFQESLLTFFFALISVSMLRFVMALSPPKREHSTSRVKLIKALQLHLNIFDLLLVMIPSDRLDLQCSINFMANKQQQQSNLHPAGRTLSSSQLRKKRSEKFMDFHLNYQLPL